jgi:hypothetical protein
LRTAGFFDHETPPAEGDPQQRAQRLQDRRLNRATRSWWESQRLLGVAAAFAQQCADRELKFLAQSLKTPRGIARLQRLLRQAIPPEIPHRLKNA